MRSRYAATSPRPKTGLQCSGTLAGECLTKTDHDLTGAVPTPRLVPYKGLFYSSFSRQRSGCLRRSPLSTEQWVLFREFQCPGAVAYLY